LQVSQAAEKPQSAGFLPTLLFNDDCFEDES
jgi:hypothetical protein